MSSAGGDRRRRRVTLWLSPAEFAAVDAAAVSVGVETGALLRQAAVTGAALVARDVSAGRVRLRGRSSLSPSAAAAESSGGAVAGEAEGSPRGRSSGPDPVRSVERVRPAPPSPPVDSGVARALAFRRAAGRLS